MAVQDHGYAPTASNRLFRFRHWRRFVEEGAEISDLLYENPPAYLTRMHAVQRDAPGAYVMDTGAAAIWGALCDDEVAARREDGVVILNVGNAHTIAVLLRGTRVEGLFEHHTGSLTGPKLAGYVEKLQAGHHYSRRGLCRRRARRLRFSRLPERRRIQLRRRHRPQSPARGGQSLPLRRALRRHDARRLLRPGIGRSLAPGPQSLRARNGRTEETDEGRELGQLDFEKPYMRFQGIRHVAIGSNLIETD